MIVDSPQGLFCPGGPFHLDPLGPVQRAVITHAHGDHARAGNAAILCTPQTAALVKRRLGEGTVIEILEYGERRRIGEVTVSLHPAGHMLGSAQVRIEGPAGVWVLSGDYKREPDPTCAPFEPLRCDVFVTEASYALPIFRWDSAASVAAEIASWWQGNARKASLLFCYALGKAQRLLAELARVTERPVFVHGAVEPFAEIYRAAGVRMLPTRLIGEERSFAGELVLAPITARGTPWMKRFRAFESGFASGLLRIRGTRRRRGFDRGFVISDHADWPGVLKTIRETGAQRVLAMHGHRDALVRWLREAGVDAAPIGLAAPPLDPEGD
ncbi:MAG: ligase-associated DNA damage response exonuclease [Deltaproteobacteria bacterium]|nr:MAG: ligase-associated DNA damage response exonuclease [Deltaproteobacteria bacterium]